MKAALYALAGCAIGLPIVGALMLTALNVLEWS